MEIEMTWSPLYDARDRLKGVAEGTFHYKAWRGEAPEGEPTLRRDLAIVLPWLPQTNNPYGPSGILS